MGDSTVQFSRGHSLATISNDDGSTTTVSVDNQGNATRTIRTTDPSTGAEVVVRRAPDMTTTRTSTLPNGDTVMVIDHPDHTVERISTTRRDDGSLFAEHTLPNGKVETTTASTDPDGTNREVKVLADGTTETRTVLQRTAEDGSVITESAGPEGMGTMRVSADGRTSTTVMSHADGTMERRTLVTDDNGGRTFTHERPDGSVETTREFTDQFGASVSIVTRPDGIELRTEISHLTLPDGSQTTTTSGPNGVSISVVKPDGSTEDKTIDTEGHIDQTFTSTRSDGTVVTEHTDIFGDVETMEQRVEAGSFTTSITRSDGQGGVNYSVGVDGSVDSAWDTMSGTRFVTHIAADGSGTSDTIDLRTGDVMIHNDLAPDPPRPQGGVVDVFEDATETASGADAGLAVAPSADSSATDDASDIVQPSTVDGRDTPVDSDSTDFSEEVDVAADPVAGETAAPIVKDPDDRSFPGDEPVGPNPVLIEDPPDLDSGPDVEIDVAAPTDTVAELVDLDPEPVFDVSIDVSDDPNQIGPDPDAQPLDDGSGM